MPTPRKYNNRTRAKAVGIAMIDGVTAAERQTGIPKETIQYWTQKPEFAHLRTTARETVVQELWIGIQVGIRELVSGLKGDAPLHHKASAFDSLAQRYSLLNGEATDRTESRELTSGYNDHEKERLRDILDGILEEPAPASVGGDPV